MEKATKKEMVDFINAQCRFEGKKIPKTKLNQLSKEQLMSIINSSPNIAEAFHQSIHHMRNEQKNMSKTHVSKSHKDKMCNENDGGAGEEAEGLEKLVEALAKDPTDFLKILEFKRLLNSLPYGTVSHEKLMVLIGKLEEPATGMALVLLNYATNQSLYFQV